ncbi:hypothetical protein [Robertmurraya massiliosenegalensis]|uniref:hypothetical protein n=1 Tax=Robertmurraya massiliosenegalensis TaxID=1287657 RepID=UPI0002F0D8BB|nr:hypothetical protein [Robertmurraya massiliosenegalensis]
MMNFSSKEIIKTFWRSYNLATSKTDYKNLLKQSKLDCLEFLSSLEDEEHLIFYDQLPLFAIISEVHRICPESVTELAEEDDFFETALNLFSTYSKEKRDLLRDTFLKQ